jgi:hypothetical protein
MVPNSEYFIQNSTVRAFCLVTADLFFELDLVELALSLKPNGPAVDAVSVTRRSQPVTGPGALAEK